MTKTGFDESKVPENFRISYSGLYWVQLSDPATGSSIVFGVDPTRCGQDLEGAIASYRAEKQNSPLSKIVDCGTLESETFGVVPWCHASVREEDLRFEQIALFAHHPADRCLVIARSEYPDDRSKPEAKLGELIRLAELIGPGI